MSFSNGYDVEFEIPSSLATQIKTETSIDFSRSSDTDKSKLIQMLCDEAQLPNVQSATGQTTGRHMGEGQVNYAHTKMYSDLSLSWMLDANLTPLKFFNSWYSFIYSGNTAGQTDAPVLKTGRRLSEIKQESSKNLNRAIRLNYPDLYMGKMKLVKTERSVNAPNGRAGIMYILEDCFPYAIDAIPLAYGTSQITRVSVNFYYAKHTVVYNEIATFAG